MKIKLDKKDFEILQALDKDFRTPFSRIAKEVGLSKNSVRLRFQKLKEIMLHNTTGVDNKLLGYTLVKLFYAIDYFNKDIEDRIINELRKRRKVAYVARHYGHYNLEIAVFVKNFDELNEQVERFNEQFSKNIDEKEIEIIVKEFFFRNKFLYEKPGSYRNIVILRKETFELSKADKEILSFLRKDPRISILGISEKTSLTPKTIIKHIKDLEKLGVITGYFMVVDHSKFDLSTFKLLIQVTNLIEEDKFEESLSSLSNVRHLSKMLGLWDYEVDVVYPSILELQQEIEILKQSFPKQIKKIELMNHGKRILTNQNVFC